jgi:hypothetical protein
MNKFPFLKLPNLFPTFESVSTFTGRALTLFIVTVKTLNPAPNLNTLVLMDLKTHKVLRAEVSETIWTAQGIISFLEQPLNEPITNTETVLHLPKQYPFSTKKVGMFLLIEGYTISLYNKPNYLRDIAIARVYFNRFVNLNNFNNISELNTKWNTKIAPTIPSNITEPQDTPTSL